MQGGTYAEALEVGFEEKQALFLSRLASETRDETILWIARSTREKKEKKIKNIVACVSKIFKYGMSFLLGVSLTILCYQVSGGL